jgi:hypothetical protein
LKLVSPPPKYFWVIFAESKITPKVAVGYTACPSELKNALFLASSFL